MTKQPHREANLALHLTYAAGMTLCTVAFVVEVLRGSGGNALSWVYVVEWPILGTVGTYLWWRLLHDDRHMTNRADRKLLHQGLDRVASGDAPDLALDHVIDEP